MFGNTKDVNTKLSGNAKEIMTDEKAIIEFVSLSDFIDVSCAKGIYHTAGDLKARAACELAVSALRERIERENPKPLTLNELREMDGEPVWITCPGGSSGAWRVCYGERARKRHGEKVIYFAVGILENISDYGKTWLAYRYKPKEAQT